MEKDFHTGHLIREVLDSQKRSVSWLAREIQCERTTCYDIFERKYVNPEQLEKISIALRYNFFRNLAEYEEGVVKNHTQV